MSLHPRRPHGCEKPSLCVANGFTVEPSASKLDCAFGEGSGKMGADLQVGRGRGIQMVAKADNESYELGRIRQLGGADVEIVHVKCATHGGQFSGRQRFARGPEPPWCFACYRKTTDANSEAALTATLGCAALAGGASMLSPLQ